MQKLSVKDLILAFPLKSLLLVSGWAYDPKKKRIKKDLDIIRITEKSWELLATRNGSWVKIERDRETSGFPTYYKGITDSEIIENTYKRTPVYEEYGRGSITVRLFYKGDKKILKGWKYISPKLDQYLSRL